MNELMKLFILLLNIYSIYSLSGSSDSSHPGNRYTIVWKSTSDLVDNGIYTITASNELHNFDKNTLNTFDSNTMFLKVKYDLYSPVEINGDPAYLSVALVAERPFFENKPYYVIFDWTQTCSPSPQIKYKIKYFSDLNSADLFYARVISSDGIGLVHNKTLVKKTGITESIWNGNYTCE